MFSELAKFVLLTGFMFAVSSHGYSQDSTIKRDNQKTKVLAEPQESALLTIFDINMDGELSKKEIESIAKRIMSFDNDGDGVISRGELIVGELKVVEARNLVAKTKTIIRSLESACIAYKLRNNRFPEALDELTSKPEGMNKRQWGGPYLEKPVKDDAWGNSYMYSCDERKNHVIIVSAGPDGQRQTADDIRSGRAR